MTFGRLMKTLRRWDETQQMRIICVDMAGDFVAGYILGRLIYWHDDDRAGHPRLRVEQHGHYWVARAHRAWFDECRLTEKQVRLALRKLVQRGLIEIRVFKFDGDPTVHLRILEEEFMRKWNFYLENPPPVDSFRPRSEEGKAVLSGHLEMAKKDRTKSPKRTIQSGQKSRSISPRKAKSLTTGTTLDTEQQLQQARARAENVVVVPSNSSELSPSPETLDLAAQLQNAGVSPDDALELARDFGEITRQQLAALPFQGKRTSPGGFLATAIRKNYGLPGAYLEHLEAQERGEKARVVAEARQVEDARQKTAQEAQNERLRARRAHLDSIWNGFDEEDRAMVRQTAIAHNKDVGEFALARIQRGGDIPITMREEAIEHLLIEGLLLEPEVAGVGAPEPAPALQSEDERLDATWNLLDEVTRERIEAQVRARLDALPENARSQGATLSMRRTLVRDLLTRIQAPSESAQTGREEKPQTGRKTA